MVDYLAGPSAGGLKNLFSLVLQRLRWRISDGNRVSRFPTYDGQADTTAMPPPLFAMAICYASCWL
jgi:hypothetical protein